MEQGFEKELKELKRHLACPKDFKCCTEGLENLCKAKDIDGEVHLKCLEASPSLCAFLMSFVGGHFCACHLRVHTVKMLGK